MAKKKYTYDYPEYREIGRDLMDGDFRLIASQTNKTENMVRMVLLYGNRNNPVIVACGRKLAEINRRKKEILTNKTRE